MKLTHFALAALLVVPGIARVLSAAEIVARATKPSAVYKENEPITIGVKVTGDDAADVGEITYAIRLGGARVVSSGKVELKNNAGEISTSLDHPGTLLVVLTGKAKDGKPLKALAGAAVDPEKIPVAAPAPDDFDAFWTAKLKELAAVPMNAKVEPVALPPATQPSDPGDSILYEKVTLDNIHGTHVFGQLARPKKPGKYPAMLIVQWAGVYPLQRDWVTSRAKQGWLAYNVIAHDVPFDLPVEEFQNLAHTTLKGYTAIGDTDRDTSYFLRMLLGDVRAADYLASRDDWDGKVMVVTGTSQGGMQSIATAALDPHITALSVLVPAGCDTLATKADRAFGWPYWQSHADHDNHGNDAAKIMNTSRYFDPVNFAPRVKVPALVGFGLLDTTAPPSSVLAMANQLGGKKELVILPTSEHQDHLGTQAAYSKRANQWFRMLRGESIKMDLGGAASQD
jgi:cephalosporin-C deacetylase-like acetyl esterase